MRIGVICPSEIAIRRFMPALALCDDFEFAGIGVYSKEERFGNKEVGEENYQKALEQEKKKAQVFLDNYGGRLFCSYEEITTSPEIDALYIPLPPALHYRWAKLALESGKHVLIEKPSTICANNTRDLSRVAEENGLALHENYMFVFHKQLDEIDKIVKSGEIGDVRLYRICFGFPMRAANDFRYNKALGGGALIDAGGYTIKYATRLLGETAKLKYAQSNYLNGYEVDMYGSASLVNDDGVTVQVAFGMDNNYKCELEIWGSKGTLTTGRVLTAPAGFVPTAVIRNGNAERMVELPSDDAFLKSLKHFVKCIEDVNERKKNYSSIVKQAELVDHFKKQASSP